MAICRWHYSAYACLILLAPLAYGSNNGNNHDSGDSTATSSGGESTSISGSGAAAGSNSISGVVVVNHNTVHAGDVPMGSESGGDTSVAINHKIDTVASSPGTINANHICASAFAGQNKLVGFSTAQVDYVCVLTRVIQADQHQAANLLNQGDTEGAAAMQVEIAKRIKELNSWVEWKRWTIRIMSVLKIALMIAVTKQPF